jgi:CRISPR-associated protein Csm5
MKTYRLKLTALSPIHIGTGEDYEPTNYVIDVKPIKTKDGKITHGYYLFEFSEFEFYKALDVNKQNEFERIVSDTSANARFKLYDFIYNNKDIAKSVSFRSKTRVLPKVAEDYKNKIGKVVQKEGGGKNVFNDFRIAKTYALSNSNKAVLPGSSLKGSISTAYQEALYKLRKDKNFVIEKMPTSKYNDIFKNILISDAIPLRQAAFIDYAVNKKRAKETKGEGVSTILEFIIPNSEFETTLICKDIDFAKIAKSCNDHYMPIFESQFDTQSDEFTKQNLDDKFVSKYENWRPKDGQFLIRAGKHSGARAVSVDGMRSIKIMKGKGRQSNYEDEETTVWLTFEGYPFGWLLCEIIE